MFIAIINTATGRYHIHSLFNEAEPAAVHHCTQKRLPTYRIKLPENHLMQQ